MTDQHGLEDLSEPTMDALSALLARDSVWDVPGPDVEERVLASVAAEAELPAPLTGPTRPGLAERRHLRIIGVAAALLLILGLTIGLLASDDGVPLQVALAGTELAPGATAVAELEDTPQGLRVRLEVSGLAPAAPGTYYQGWIKSGSDAVTIGTFHARGGAGVIELWAGVSSDQYNSIAVTLQQEGAGAESSGLVVLSGTLEK